MRGATNSGLRQRRYRQISIHAPLAGCDTATSAQHISKFIFQSTHPLRGATTKSGNTHVIVRFQSTHPLRGATGRWATRDINHLISIHAPLAGCDAEVNADLTSLEAFQSTHPLRGATLAMLLASTRSWEFQSTHPLRGATCTGCSLARLKSFQSTHPLRGATCYFFLSIPFPIISIHAPLAGCDLLPPLGHDKLLDFNPRTPCGVRRILCRMAARKSRFQSTHPLRGATFATILDSKLSKFQSTHPLRGATNRLTYNVLSNHISIHAPLAGCDYEVQPKPMTMAEFQSTHPLRGATARAARYRSTDVMLISIHAPLAGCDSENAQNFLRILR